MVLPHINMNLPRAYTCSPSWTPHPPPSPYHPSRSSQCTSPKGPYWTWTGDSFPIWYYTCFHDIPPIVICVFALVAHIMKNWNNTEKISMAPAQGWNTNLWSLPYFSVTASRGGMGRKVARRFKSGGHRYPYGWFMLMFWLKTVQYCKAIPLHLNIKKFNSKNCYWGSYNRFRYPLYD